MKILKLLIVSFIYFNLNCVIPKPVKPVMFNLTIKNQSTTDLSSSSILSSRLNNVYNKSNFIKANTTKSFKVSCISLFNVYDLNAVSILKQKNDNDDLCRNYRMCSEPEVLSSFNWCPEKDLTLIFDGTKLFQEVDSPKTN